MRRGGRLSAVLGRRVEVGGDASEEFDERLALGVGEVGEGPLGDGVKQTREGLSHLTALVSEGDQHAATVRRIGSASQQPGGLHALDHSYDGGDLDVHPPGQLSSGERLLGA